MPGWLEQRLWLCRRHWRRGTVQAVRRFLFPFCSSALPCVILCDERRRWLTGPYCRICNVTDGSRYYDSSISACVPCEGGSVTTPLAILGVILVVVLLLLVWWGWRKPYNRVPRQLRNRLHKMAHESLSAMRPPLKQMLAFYQASLP